MKNMFSSLLTRRASLHAFAILAVALCPSFAQEQESASAPQLNHIKLGDKANRSLSHEQHEFPGNNLAKLELGEKIYAGVKFRVEASILALSGKEDDEQGPKKIEGIKVDATARRLHFLHGTGYGDGGYIVAAGTEIGSYMVQYADKTSAKIPIMYGEDVRDWWTWGKPVEVTKGKVAWSGTNEFSEKQKQKIHLYLTTWENPKPAVKILAIDYVSANSSAAPFCVAITAE